MAHLYSNPEEKLWLVIKHFPIKTPSQSSSNSKGYRLEKNDIIKFGRVRLRVRDIDYADKKDALEEF